MRQLTTLNKLFFACLFLLINGHVFSQQIGVIGNGSYISDNDLTPAAADHTDFAATTSRVFSIDNIQNSGNTTLTVSSITLSNATDFTISSPLADNTIRKNDTPVPFTISLTASGCGITYTSDVIIASNASNDGGDNVWTYRISATITPEADIVDISLVPISDFSTDSPSVTNSTDFGSIGVGGSSGATTYVIQNNGTCNLTLAPLPLVVLSNTTDFTLDTTGMSSSIAPGNSTTFTVTFNPLTIGTKTSTVNITNNDSDEPNYTFTVQGVGVTPQPEINVQGNTTDIVSGQTVTSATDHTDFGNVNAGGFFDRTFTIQNTGTLALTIPSAVTTASGSDFTIQTQPTSPIIPGGSSTFVVRFTPSSSGILTDTVSIPSNDSDENPYTFDVSGTSYLIPPGGVWSYLDDGSDQGTAWQTSNAYNTVPWASGNAQLGYGDGDEVTVVSYGPDASNKYPTTYFRRSFTATASDVANTTLNMNAVVDDGMVVYINGTEVWRDNMPTGTILYNTYAAGVGSDLNNFISLNVANILNVGTNEIAVEIHQASASSSDISFDFFMYTSNDYIFVPPTKPDNDLDDIADYKDSDDDNDGLTDQLEGCHSGQLEDLNSDPYGAGSEESLLSNFPFTQTLDDGNTIDYSYTGTFTDITSYDAGDHGWSIRTKGPGTAGTLTLDFADPVDNLTFRLIDFDEDETYTVNAYDDSNNLIDLITNVNIYYLGSYIQQTGNTVTDSTNGGSTNNDGEDIDSDQYGTAYFYFPNVRVSKIDFIVDQPIGSSIRIAGIEYCNLDTDGDGVEDYHDSDSDNDGIPDLVESGGTDINGDGIVDDLTDNDKDGLADIVDNDASKYNTYETTKLEPFIDFDNDGVYNSRDLDSDNDGIADIIEIGEADTDGNGQIDGFTDINLDGYHDSYDGVSSRLITGSDTDADGFPNSYPNANLDGTGYPNFMDIDSDDDGITDNTEAQATTAYITYTATDTDNDGVLNIFDNSGSFGGSGLIPVDTDYDGTPDYLDLDSDDHEENDIIEGHDTNGDGVINGSDSPSAGTGIFIGVDSDNDGLDDGFDNNTSSPIATNTSLQPTSHPIVDGGYDRDWRATTSSIDFDGLNDYIDIGDNHDLPHPFSLEAWILQEVTKPLGTIISKRDAKTTNKRGYHLGITNTNHVILRWFDDSGNTIANLTSSDPITNNKWHHVAATFDGTTAKIYIDGIEVGNSTPSSPPSNTSYKFFIGAMHDSSSPSTPIHHFNGFIDEVRIWNVGLSATQIREMMNQEIEQNSTAVRGKIIPIDISGGLLWANLKGYYPMTSNTSEDRSNNTFHGNPKNITTTEPQTAPMPYTTVRNGTWTDTSGATPWTYGNSVWNYPNSNGVDGTPIDWNIVVTSHNVTSGNKDLTVRGLITETTGTTLTIADPSDDQDETNSGQSLRVTHYLELDGNIDLVGESQLLQDEGSILDADSGGYIERDQQGTGDSYSYNYWTSSVGPIGTGLGTKGIGINSTNTNFSLASSMSDGTDTDSPEVINFQPAYNAADGTVTSPITLSQYWLWKFNGTDDDYDSWTQIDEHSSLLPGEGFTMKGSSGESGLSYQNYIFRGKPNNGDITLNVGLGNNRLIGNPYPSAIDANEFILDNINDSGGRAASNIINGALYFWDHFSGGTHILSEYVGGYGTYTLMGGVKAVSNDTRINNNNNVSIVTPQRYIPVNQGFFVNATLDNDTDDTTTTVTGGTVIFKNSQRVFSTESSGSSIFFRNSSQRTSEPTIDERAKITLMFNSAGGYHRPLLVGADDNATEDFDLGFEAPLIENINDDMYWMINDRKFVIQAINNFNSETIIPLGLHTSVDGLNNITIDNLENVPDDVQIYVHDKELDYYHNIRTSAYEIYLPIGEYLNRFELTFDYDQPLSTEDNALSSSLNVFYNNTQNSIMIQNPKLIEISNIQLFDVLGQSLINSNSVESRDHIEIKTRPLSTGTYIINLETKDGTAITKKVLVK
ncbi:choice-of-anchor D domain-containing protein [Hanstruepera ponticola]|uniref:choice-of-anchor D domain-containing protein n=1 Tax=Hanstruepera ponticola TaxID=2042995 RepID=UPI000CF1C633|nr:choice-of-anchor D domain-containing protein [Hanstruepera ponticola]